MSASGVYSSAVKNDVDRTVSNARREQPEALVVRRAPALEVGAHNDPAERAADEMAARVVAALRTPGPPVGAGGDGARRADPMSSAGGAVQRDAAPRRVQRAAGRSEGGVIGADGGPVSDEVSARIARSAGSGRSLDEPVRRTMERAFGGVSFDQVRVHEGAESRQLNDTLGARAFTLGRDIHFRDGVPDARSSSGQRLLAHELTHTLQQGGVGRRTIRRDLTKLGGLQGSLSGNAPPTPGTGRGKHAQANDWLTGMQGGTAAPGEFASANSYQQSIKDSGGTGADKVGSTQVGNNFNAASSAMSGFDLIVGVSKMIQAFQDTQASGWDKADATLAVGGAATKTAAGIGETVKGFMDAGKDSVTAAASSVLGEIAAIFTTIQAGFSIVKQIAGATTTEGTQDKAMAGATIVKGILEAGKAVVETINAFMSHLGSAVTGMVQAVPAIGIAISVLEWIMNGINIGFAYVAWAAMQLDKRASKTSLLGAPAAKSKGIRGLFGGHVSAVGEAAKYTGQAQRDELDLIDQAIVTAGQERNNATGDADTANSEAQRIQQEIDTKFGTKQRPLTKKDQKELDNLKAKLAKAQGDKSNAEMRAAKHKQAFDEKTAAKTQREAKGKEAEEYLVSKNLQRIAAKRIHRGILNISTTLPSVAGDIATLSGVGAGVGAGLKVAGGGAKLAAVGIRNAKQAYHNYKGDDKSETNKLKMYDDLIRKMTQHAIDAGSNQAKQEKALREIEASGMSMMTITRLQADPGKLYAAWITALKKR